eukprot:1142355-Pelagomonas_calceolata.AAC.11
MVPRLGEYWPEWFRSAALVGGYSDVTSLLPKDLECCTAGFHAHGGVEILKQGACFLGRERCLENPFRTANQGANYKRAPTVSSCRRFPNAKTGDGPLPLQINGTNYLHTWESTGELNTGKKIPATAKDCPINRHMRGHSYAAFVWLGCNPISFLMESLQHFMSVAFSLPVADLQYLLMWTVCSPHSLTEFIRGKRETWAARMDALDTKSSSLSNLVCFLVYFLKHEERRPQSWVARVMGRWGTANETADTWNTCYCSYRVPALSTHLAPIQGCASKHAVDVVYVGLVPQHATRQVVLELRSFCQQLLPLCLQDDLLAGLQVKDWIVAPSAVRPKKERPDSQAQFSASSLVCH